MSTVFIFKTSSSSSSYEKFGWFHLTKTTPKLISTHAMVHVSINKSNVNQLQLEKVNQSKFISKVHLRDIIQKNINKVVM